MRRPAPAGFALPVVLLVLVCVTVLAHGVLLLARQEAVVARSVVGATQARLAAEAGVGRALASEVFPHLALLEPGGEAVLAEGELAPSFRYRAHGRRLDTEHFLVVSDGWREPDGGRRRVGRLVWVLDPGARLAAMGAVVQAGGGVTIHGDGEIEADPVTIPPEGWEEGACASVQVLADSVLGAGALPPVASEQAQEGRAPGEGPYPTLGVLDVTSLSHLASARVTGFASPRPSVSSGVCADIDPRNWGSPSDPGGPCGGHFPLVSSDGSLVVDGGEGQGILAVDGDLELGDVRFMGLVLVSGSAVLRAGSRIDGFLLAGRAVRIGAGAVVRGSACPLLRALLAVPDLRKGRPYPRGSWIEPS